MHLLATIFCKLKAKEKAVYCTFKYSLWVQEEVWGWGGLWVFPKFYVQDVKKKKCFFTIYCNPFLAYILLQENFKVLNTISVYNLSYWLAIFCTTNSKILKKKHFPEHPVTLHTHTYISVTWFQPLASLTYLHTKVTSTPTAWSCNPV